MQGLKYLRKIRPLLSRLRKVGTECDRAGNRRLFMDQYSALILMSLFSPAIESLRDLQRACALDKVRKRLGVTRASLGSLSESVAIFDPAPLKEIAVELRHTIRSKPNDRFAAVGQRITAVDGTVIATVKRVAKTRVDVDGQRPEAFGLPAAHALRGVERQAGADGCDECQYPRGSSPRWRSHGLVDLWGSLLRRPRLFHTVAGRGCPYPRAA